MIYSKDIKVIKAIFMAILAWGLISVIFPSKAQAQSLGNVITGIGEATGVIPRHCRFSAIQASCYVNHANQLNAQREFRRQRQIEQENRRREQEIRRANALQRACDLGDRLSCESVQRIQGRGLPRTEQQIKLDRALAEACRAGDRASCSRLRR